MQYSVTVYTALVSAFELHPPRFVLKTWSHAESRVCPSVCLCDRLCQPAWVYVATH